MSDVDFVDILSPTLFPSVLSPTISVSSRLTDPAEINDEDEAVATTDQISTPIHDLRGSSEEDHLDHGPETNQKFDGADADALPLLDEESVQPKLELSSFLPIIQALSSILHRGAQASPDDHYYFRGTASSTEIQELESLAHTVDAFNLTKSSHEHIPVAMILRLLRNRSWSHSFFPALRALRVTDANVDTMSFLDLFYSPTLESFELTDFNSWSNSCINELQNFLHNLPLEAPNLSVIRVLLDGSTLQVYINWPLDFVHLRELHLSNVTINDWQSLRDLSELSSLTILDLKLAIPQSYNRQFWQENRDLDDWDAIVDSPQREAPTGFRNLIVLKISAVIEVLDDLVGMVASNSLQELDMGLLASSSEPPPYITNRRRRAFINSKTSFTPRNEDSYFFFLLLKVLLRCSTIKCIALGQSQESIGQGQLLRDHFIPSTTLEELLQTSVEHLTIVGWKINFNIPVSINIVGRNTYLRSLSFPVDPLAYHAAEPPGFPLSALSSIAYVFPNLASFQGYIIRLISNIPDFLPVDSVPHNPSHHALRSLSLGVGQLHWDSEDTTYSLQVAFYLDRLFPNLQSIVSGGKDSEDWRFIERAVKMCQACRALT